MEQCIIEKGAITYKGEKLFSAEGGASFADFAKQALHFLQVDYPKFFKMDNLSKLAFLAAEVLLQALPPQEKKGVALLFANRSASLDTDLRHQRSIADPNNYYPSPAVFVYTLPNICLGEVSIRHGLHTENAFFVFDAYPEDFFTQYSSLLLQRGLAERVLCAWVDFLEGDYKAVATLI